MSQGNVIEGESRRSVVRAGVLVTLAMALGASLYLALTPHGANRTLLFAVVGLAALDAAVIWAVRGRLAASQRFGAILTAWNAAHIVVATAISALDGGLGSPFVAIFFLSVAFAAVALPKRSVVAIASLDVLGVFVTTALGDPVGADWAEAGMWAAGVVVTAAVCAVIAEDRARRLRALQDSKEEMLHRLARVVEFRDDETAGHVERMSEYTELLAGRMGLGHMANDLRLASTMHDIGKVAVPDAVLLKPGRLDPEERAVMERHAAVGHDMLSGSASDVLRLAATIALTHHERYDGTGYPNGLAGEEIPLVGRIVAIADVFDALTSDRVYKRAIPVDEAVEVIRRERGAHFDPAVVDAFLAVRGELEAIRSRHRGDALLRDASRQEWDLGRPADRSPEVAGRVLVPVGG